MRVGRVIVVGAAADAVAAAVAASLAAAAAVAPSLEGAPAPGSAVGVRLAAERCAPALVGVAEPDRFDAVFDLVAVGLAPGVACDPGEFAATWAGACAAGLVAAAFCGACGAATWLVPGRGVGDAVAREPAVGLTDGLAAGRVGAAAALAAGAAGLAPGWLLLAAPLPGVGSAVGAGVALMRSLTAWTTLGPAVTPATAVLAAIEKPRRARPIGLLNNTASMSKDSHYEHRQVGAIG